jgi:putative membrane protein
VNAFDAPTGTEVTDYGNYSAVKNLSGTEALDQNGESVTFAVSESPFYYQGNCADTAIPWDIGIVYVLDGNEISAQDLAGKSGSLKSAFRVGRRGSLCRIF